MLYHLRNRLIKELKKKENLNEIYFYFYSFKYIVQIRLPPNNERKFQFNVISRLSTHKYIVTSQVILFNVLNFKFFTTVTKYFYIKIKLSIVLFIYSQTKNACISNRQLELKKEKKRNFQVCWKIFLSSRY